MKTAIVIVGLLLLLLPGINLYAQDKPLSVGDSVPMFALKDQNDSIINIKDLIGKNILVIYFYPKDESFVCTKEACTFRDNFNDFQKLGAMVIGINYGSVESHKKFCQKDKLPFILLSDSNNMVFRKFGLKTGITTERATFVIDHKGKIVFTYNSMLHGADHAEKTLNYIKEMKSGQ